MNVDQCDCEFVNCLTVTLFRPVAATKQKAAKQKGKITP